MEIHQFRSGQEITFKSNTELFYPNHKRRISGRYWYSGKNSKGIKGIMVGYGFKHQHPLTIQVKRPDKTVWYMLESEFEEYEYALVGDNYEIY